MTVIRRNRRHLGGGGTAAQMRALFDIPTVRQTVTSAITTFEAARDASRLSVFRLQAAEDMSIRAIAREWGLSRQLISRRMEERPTGRASET